MSQAEDIDAIDQYMRKTSSQTNDASVIRSNWISWYEKLGWFEKNMNKNTYNDARAKRNAFNVANAVSPAEKAQVEQVLATGMTTEQMEADPKTPSKVKPPVTKVVKHPTIRQGSTGDAVKEWQAIIGASPVDGRFGPATKTLTKTFQRAHKILDDGVVGPQTWMAAYVSDTVHSNTPAPQAVIDSTGTLPPARAPIAAKVVQKAKTAPPIYQKPIGEPVKRSEASGVLQRAEAGMTGMITSPSMWSMPAKLVGAAFAGLAVFFGMKAAREAGDGRHRRVA